MTSNEKQHCEIRTIYLKITFCPLFSQFGGAPLKLSKKPFLEAVSHALSVNSFRWCCTSLLLCKHSNSTHQPGKYFNTLYLMRNFSNGLVSILEAIFLSWNILDGKVICFGWGISLHKEPHSAHFFPILSCLFTCLIVLVTHYSQFLQLTYST